MGCGLTGVRVGGGTGRAEPVAGVRTPATDPGRGSIGRLPLGATDAEPDTDLAGGSTGGSR